MKRDMGEEDIGDLCSLQESRVKRVPPSMGGRKA
jgi:hypothetical protein